MKVSWVTKWNEKALVCCMQLIYSTAVSLFFITLPENPCELIYCILNEIANSVDKFRNLNSLFSKAFPTFSVFLHYFLSLTLEADKYDHDFSAIFEFCVPLSDILHSHCFISIYFYQMAVDFYERSICRL